MTNEISVNQWIKNFDDGTYSASDRATQIKAGFFDWFCKDTSLKSRLYRMAPKVKALAKSKLIDCNNAYVFFKNNCPVVGGTYDDFRFCDIDTGDVLYTVIPKGREGTSEVYGRDNGFKGPLASGTWKDVLKFFEV